jgi:hypothetical protein
VQQVQGLSDGTDGTDRTAARLSERARTLLPQLDESLAQAETPSERLLAILDSYPNRIALPSDAHVHGNAQRSMENFLELGIKASVDSFKSDTAVPVFAKRLKRLERIMDEAAPNSATVDYSKGTARKLNAGTYDHEAACQRLSSNTTLPAQLTEECGDELNRRGKLQLPPLEGPMRPLAELPSALEIHNRAREREPAVSAQVQQLLAALGGTRRDPENTVRSSESIESELAGGSESGLAARRSPLALRYVLEWPAAEFTRRCKEAMGGFSELGHAVVQVNNAFAMRDPQFLGVSMTLEAPDGYRFGVQFHTPASYEAKQELHDMHKQVQDERRKEQPDQDRVHALEQTMRERNATVVRPPDVGSITTWYEEPLEGVTQLRQSQQVRTQAVGTATPARALAEQAKQMQVHVTPAMQHVAQAAKARLAGNATVDNDMVVEAPLDSRYLKSVQSLKEKIKREVNRHRNSDPITPQEAAMRVQDALRYVLVWPTADFSDGARQALAALRTQGLQVRRARNHFVEGDGTYKGINLVLADRDGYQFELQLHTNESYAVKAKNHLSYKKADQAQARLDTAGTDDNAIALYQDKVDRERQRMRQATSQVPVPAGVDTLVLKTD